MAGGGFNPLKPPMPPGVNRLGLPDFNPMGGGGGGSRNVLPPTPHLGLMQGRMQQNGNDPYASGAPGMPAGGSLQNAIMSASGPASIAPGGSMAQFGGPPRFQGPPQMSPQTPAPQLPGGAIMQNWGLQPPGQTLGSQPMGGPVGIGQAPSVSPPNQVNDTYMHMPRGYYGNQ